MKENEKSLLDSFFEWREKHIPQNRFVLILSFLVGVISALAAFTLKHFIEFIQELLTSGFSVFSGNWLYLIYPVIGIFFSGLFSKFHFHVARIHIKIGSADAATTAMLWCAISTGLKPILIFLDKKSNLHGMKTADIKITTDYLSEEIKADVKLAFSLSIGGVLGVLFRTAFSFLFGWFKIKPSVPAEPADKSSADKKEDNPKGKKKQSSKKKKACDSKEGQALVASNA